MKTVNEKIRTFIAKHNMLADGDTVILAVSGGADSMCLLHFFNVISTEMRLNIICAHVNHGIRGVEADSDEEFVRNYCKANSIRFECAHFDVPSVSSETGESCEECGRRLRYEFFKSIDSDAKIATAHNLNDSMETVIFNLARGTSLKGLTGIPSVRDNIIRPVLCLTRAEIEQYNSFYGIDYVTDSTNASDDYARNKIRHNIIPVMNEINNGFASVFESCVSSLSETERYLDKIADDAYNTLNNNNRWSVKGLLELDSVIRNRVIVRICENAGACDISRKHIDLIDSVLENGGAVMLHGGVTIKSDSQSLYVPCEKIQEQTIYFSVDKQKREYIFSGLRIEFVDVDKSILNNYNIKIMSSHGFMDADMLDGAVFRSRQAGDRFKFPYAEHSKSLKNLYKEKNISPESRFGVPMLVRDDNVLWINGVGVSDYAKVTQDTARIVKIITADCRKVEFYE